MKSANDAKKWSGVQNFYFWSEQQSSYTFRVSFVVNFDENEEMAEGCIPYDLYDETGHFYRIHVSKHEASA